MSDQLPQKVVAKMYGNDPFSKWLGIEIVSVEADHVSLKMVVRKEMLNGFGVGHGGICFSLADSAFAFAANTRGQVGMGIENHITLSVKVVEGDVLYAVAEPLSLGNRISNYGVTVAKEDGTKVAHFRGTVYHTKQDHFPKS